MEKSVRCDCIGGEHYLHFYAFKDEKGEEDPIVYVDINAREKHPLKIKIREIIKYLRNKEPLCLDGIVLNKEKSEEIIKFLQDFWERQGKNDKIRKD